MFVFVFVLTLSGGGGVRGVRVDVLLELGLCGGGHGRATQEGRGYRAANVDVSKRISSL